MCLHFLLAWHWLRSSSVEMFIKVEIMSCREYFKDEGENSRSDLLFKSILKIMP